MWRFKFPATILLLIFINQHLAKVLAGNDRKNLKKKLPVLPATDRVDIAFAKNVVSKQSIRLVFLVHRSNARNAKNR